jgi:hypothetical protein
MTRLAVKIIENSIPEPNTGCWLWEKSLYPNGYGQINVAGKGMGAHRASWAAFKGAIPKGLMVLHRCDNPCCVNPAHLFLGTHQDNMDDRRRKDREHHPKGELQGGHKLTEAQVREIKAITGPLALAKAQEVGKAFGVSPFHVYRIRSGKKWAHLGEGQ